MASFSQELVPFSRPFTYTGKDYAGPFDIINYTERACPITKGYVLVFVCFSTKAIHLESTSDLTTEKFISAFAGGKWCLNIGRLSQVLVRLGPRRLGYARKRRRLGTSF